jgi:hypothetical protein
LVLQEFEDVFQEIPGFPPRREIVFSIDLVPGAAPVSKTPYKMSTRVKRITNAVGGIVEERVHMSKCFTWGSEISLILLIKIFATDLMFCLADLIHWGFLNVFQLGV